MFLCAVFVLEPNQFVHIKGCVIVREILFRGKRIDNGKWIYGFPVPSVGLDAGKWLITAIQGNAISSSTYAVDAATIGEFTGLYDIYGVMIFEGDIVRHGYTCKYSDGKTANFFSNMPVSFSSNYGGWIIGDCNILTTKNIKKYSIEVIGNIYDTEKNHGR